MVNVIYCTAAVIQRESVWFSSSARRPPMVDTTAAAGRPDASCDINTQVTFKKTKKPSQPVSKEAKGTFEFPSNAVFPSYQSNSNHRFPACKNCLCQHPSFNYNGDDRSAALRPGVSGVARQGNVAVTTTDREPSGGIQTLIGAVVLPVSGGAAAGVQCLCRRKVQGDG